LRNGPQANIHGQVALKRNVSDEKSLKFTSTSLQPNKNYPIVYQNNIQQSISPLASDFNNPLKSNFSNSRNNNSNGGGGSLGFRPLKSN
jgi:hypothetical protein